MTGVNELEARLQALESGPHLCPTCQRPHNTTRAVDLCCAAPHPARTTPEDTP